ncbi:ZIP family metal transporter [soil metagenome]
MIAPLALFCLAIVLASLLGGGLPLVTVLTHTRLQVYLSLAAGAMLGAAFFHMLPEAVEIGSASILPWAAAGLLTMFLLERFFSFHHHEPPARSTDQQGESHRGHGPGHSHAPGQDHASTAQGSQLHWGAAAFGLAVHTLTGGVALASAVASDYATRGGLGAASWGVFLATVIHKPADALTIVSLMLHNGPSRAITHLVNLGFALMLPLGVLLFWLGAWGLDHDQSLPITAAALAFSAGTFLCIALSDLLPELQFHSHDRVKLSLALLAGIALMAAASFWEGDHHHHTHAEEAEHEAHQTH